MGKAGKRATEKAIADAYAKLARGEKLGSHEARLIRVFERDREEQLRWEYYASIPQKHWVAMSGRHQKILGEQAQRYSLPLGGPVIDLPKLARALHDFLAKNSHKLLADELPTGDDLLNLYRAEKAALARMDRLQREGNLIPREQIREAHNRIAGLIRAAGDAIARQYGNDAMLILVEALEDAEAEIESCFGRADTIQDSNREL